MTDLASLVPGAAVLTAALVELALRLPFAPVLRALMRALTRSGRVIRARASDHWKEKAMLGCSARTLRASLMLLALIAALAATAGAGIVAIGLAVPGFAGWVFSGAGMGTVFALAMLHVWLRRAIRQGRLRRAEFHG